MKGHVDKSMGTVTLMTEVSTNIKPTDPVRLDKQTECKKRNWSGNGYENDWISQIHVTLTTDPDGNVGFSSYNVYLFLKEMETQQCHV